MCDTGRRRRWRAHVKAEYGVAPTCEQFGQMKSDETSAPGNENSQPCLLRRGALSKISRRSAGAKTPVFIVAKPRFAPAAALHLRGTP